MKFLIILRITEQLKIIKSLTFAILQIISNGVEWDFVTQKSII